SRRCRQSPQVHIDLALSVFPPVDCKEPSLSAAHSQVGSRGRAKETRDERSPDAESGGSGARRRRPSSGRRVGGSWLRRPWPRSRRSRPLAKGSHGHWHGGHGHWHGGRGWGWGGWGGGWGPRVYVGPSHRRGWAPGYGWV